MSGVKTTSKEEGVNDANCPNELSDRPRTQIESLHRDFQTGRLWARGLYYSFGRSMRVVFLIAEPICEAHKLLIGEMPIPPMVGKVDL
jgi:hypothetical protein